MIWETAIVIFLLSLTVLVYLTIPLLLKFRESLKKLNQTIDTVNNDLPGIMTNVNEICDSLNNTVQKVESTVDDVVELEQIITNEIKEPLKNIAQAIAMLLQLANKLFDRKAK